METSQLVNITHSAASIKHKHFASHLCFVIHNGCLRRNKERTTFEVLSLLACVSSDVPSTEDNQMCSASFGRGHGYRDFAQWTMVCNFIMYFHI